jgi:outer membrane protein OmpA-like peptidoglycan-associated protein
MVKLPAIYRKSLISLLLFLIYFSLWGQLWPSDQDMYAEAEDYLIEEEYKEALPIYLKLIEKGYNTANIKYKIGECYLYIPGQKQKALSYLKEASEKASEKYTGTELNEENAPETALFLLAIAYRLHNKFDKAIEAFNVMKDLIPQDDLENRKIIDMHISRCKNAVELTSAPINIKKTKLSNIINSKFSNYSPLLTADESVIIYMEKRKFYDAVMRSVVDKGYWTNPQNLTPKIKSDGEYYAVGISTDGNHLLLYAFDPETNGDIYQSDYINRKWSRITKLNDNINTEYNETHASFSNSGNVLIFTSNRKGGYGGLDIYKSKKDENGDWGPAENLGPVINTPFNEESPFVTIDGRMLFFSSQGHYNMGGYDLFKSELAESGEWLPPINIGYPINSSDDDIFFHPAGDGKKGYHSKFAVNENNEQDIFKYEILTVANPQKFKISGLVNIPDSKDYELNDILVKFIDLKDNDTLVTMNCDNDGKYKHKISAGEYELTFSVKGNQFDSKTISIPLNFPEEELIVNAEMEIPDTVKAEEDMILVAVKDTFYIDDIFFAFDSYALNKDAIKFLNNLTKLLIKYPNLLIHINGFTDSIGSAEYNQLLSVRRAKSVGSFLEKSQIIPDRIKITGYGETRHKAVNSTSEGRQINRRVEIEIPNPGDNLILINSFVVPDNLAID